MESILRDKKGRFIKGIHPKTEFKKGCVSLMKDKYHSEETRKKMSVSSENRFKIKTNHPMYRRHHTEETKLKMSKARMGKPNSNKGKPCPATSGINHWNWQGGISFEPYNFDFNKELKELIRQRDNYQCQLCGMPECENIRKLDIHHIDYDKENCSPDNLITLCRKCNSKVNFNRNYWTNYFKKD